MRQVRINQSIVASCFGGVLVLLSLSAYARWKAIPSPILGIDVRSSEHVTKTNTTGIANALSIPQREALVAKVLTSTSSSVSRQSSQERTIDIKKWILDTRAGAFRTETSVKNQKTCPPRNFVVMRQKCGGNRYGFGNCMLGLLSGLQLAVMTDSIPVFEIANHLLRDTLQAKHEWTRSALLPCYRHRLEKIRCQEDARHSFPRLPKWVLALLNQNMSMCFAVDSYHFFAQEFIASPLLRGTAARVFPGAFADPFNFGSSDMVFHAFFAFKQAQEQVPKALTSASTWSIRGPLVAVHVRRGLTKAMFRHPDQTNREEVAAFQGVFCLEQVLAELNASTIRVFISTTKIVAWQSYATYYEFPESGGLAQRHTAGRTVEFRVGPGIYEEHSKYNLDQKSVHFFHDWYVLSHSDVVIRPLRTSYSSTAIAIGRPSLTYLFTAGPPATCSPLRFREACMMDQVMSSLTNYSNDIFKEYYAYCKMIGEGT